MVGGIYLNLLSTIGYKILILASNVNNASIGDRSTGNPHINCYTEQIAGNMFKNGSKFFYEYNRNGKK